MSDPAVAVAAKRVEVDTDAIRANAAAVVADVGSRVQVMAMVKANGYGHGLRIAADAALAGGATWLGVASAAEAAAVDEPDVPVLVVGWSDPRSHEGLVRAGVHITVFDPDAVESVAAAARRVGRRARVHVKIDTGMHRLGVAPDDVGILVRALAARGDDVDVVGVFTHFADSEQPDQTFTAEQHDRFVHAARGVLDHAPDALVHCANSGAILRAPHLHHDLVRLGIALYGYPPATVRGLVALRPAMTMLAPVTQVRSLRAGDTVGYGRTWTAPANALVATVGAGYADGVLRAQSNTGRVLVHGCRCPIIGLVSMDQLAVDVSEVGADVRVGDEAVLFGGRAGVHLGADEVGASVGTIPHEVLCAVPDRIPRVVVSRA